MAIIRHAAAPLRSVRCIRNTTTTVAPTTSAATRNFSLTARRQGGHGPSYDPPTGWLWGIKPGEKAEPEGWEWPMWIFCGSLLAAGVAYAYKPDTTVSTWALEEARRRLEAEGILPDPSAKGEKKD